MKPHPACARLAVCALVALPAFAAAPATAATVYVVKGPAVRVLPGPGPADVYDSGDDLEVGCGRGGAPLAAGWTGVGGPVARVRPQLSDPGASFVLETRRPIARSAPRALAICARGAGTPTLAEGGGQKVSCGAKLALGVAANTTWPYVEVAVTAQPVGIHGWQLKAGIQTRAAAICVAPRAFAKTKTVSATRAFAPGAASATVTARCDGGRRPIGWGYAAPTMDDNGWSSADTASKLTVPFVAASQPAGVSGWSLTFRTPDQRGARTAAKVTAYVTCAVPAASASASAATAPSARAAALRKPTAEVERCAKLKGSAKRACSARNAANRAVLKKLLDTRLVGARGDGAEVDWSFCRSGRLVTAVTSGGSTGRSTSNNWQVENAKVGQGGKWFDAIVTSRDGTAIAVAMRGGRWKVGIESFDEVSELGDAVRSSAKETCAAA
ncbi:hypothetical protein Q5424_09625 [Conexibacter sp. JD483]|uniref:hypothetical protein n=1 Tax=unclassified Conexibacter TaxID=2627773 RepID=UPI0027169976|nr:MULTISPECIES: hypothetical protein [unclassified Conexibacter]MDO8185447.1 hypothetical protein [Conexibacter sp. CPCC 205706]MDO8198377.1 hypothetical protein [Conexibacter sp. CPCC 205762]MDR9369339.1 hypothetical protein [Conexibacter sp. JD483]